MWAPTWLIELATLLSDLMIRLLKLVSIPMIFLSVIATIGGMDSLHEVKQIGKRVLGYAVATTYCAALLGLGLFWLLRPNRSVPALAAQLVEEGGTPDWRSALLELIPNNALAPFLENQVVGVMFLALLFGLALVSLPEKERRPARDFFKSLFSALLKVAGWLVALMPAGVFAFTTLFVNQFLRGEPLHLPSFALYLLCVLGANLIQGLIILPLFVKARGLSPWRIFKGTYPALTLAFLTRSSNAALPLTLASTQKGLGLSRRVSQFSIPLCSTINMNACAGFITITVLYVGTHHGLSFSPLFCLGITLIALLAAMGNAGVPMGCFWLSSAILAAMGVPLTLMGMIFPVYVFLDMVETALNVWSDICVTAIVDKEIGAGREELAQSTTSTILSQ